MRKMNKKISVWMMAGVLAFGGISAAGGAVPVLAAEEKKEEKDSEKKIRPSDLALMAQDSYSYADMGLSFELPKLLLEKMEKKAKKSFPNIAFIINEYPDFNSVCLKVTQPNHFVFQIVNILWKSISLQ